MRRLLSSTILAPHRGGLRMTTSTTIRTTPAALHPALGAAFPSQAIRHFSKKGKGLGERRECLDLITSSPPPSCSPHRPLLRVPPLPASRFGLRPQDALVTIKKHDLKKHYFSLAACLTHLLLLPPSLPLLLPTSTRPPSVARRTTKNLWSTWLNYEGRWNGP